MARKKTNTTRRAKQLIILLSLLGITTCLNAQTIYTAKTGKWSDPAVWIGGKVPPAGSNITVASGHILTIDSSREVSGLEVMKGGTLQFLISRSVTLTTTQNINIFGKLVISPISIGYIHTIIFKGVDETKYIGGGMDIYPSDIGLWVRDSGTVYLTGSEKTAYVNLKDSAVIGSKKIKLSKAPTNWRVGDTITIAPTDKISQRNFYLGFDTRRIVAILRDSITLDSPLVYNHPRVLNPFNNTYLTAEVLNLTRNVKIQGTPTGRAHINIGMVSTPITVKNVEIRYMGPRQVSGTTTVKVLSRYAFHLHMNGYGTVGSLVRNVVVRDAGSHAFVPHNSHGVTFENCISFNTFEDAYWWDVPTSISDTSNNSHNTTYNGCVAAMIKCDPPYQGYRLTGFVLGSGKNNTTRKCITIGNQGNASSSGFLWPESSNYTDNVWTIDSNIAHNNKRDGIFTWQNDPHAHNANRFILYNNGYSGIEHGAYVNGYKYHDNMLINNFYGMLIHANPIRTGEPDLYGYNTSVINTKSTDTLYITRHTLAGQGPILFKDCIFPGVIVSELPPRVLTPPPGLFDFVDCGLTKEKFVILGMEKGSLIRVQNGTTAFQISSAGIVDIQPFFKP
jgi:hypothetical protein